LSLEAVLWDVDGTLAETERDGHLVAFNAAFEKLDIPWRWDEIRYGELLRVAGGFERLLFDMESQPLAPASMDERRALAQRVHVLKNQRYGEIVSSGALPLRAGVRELFDDCAASGVRMAIVTTTSRGNVDGLLGAHFGQQWRERFAAIVCAEDAPVKKPDPQAYRLVLQRLQLQAAATVAIEDSPAGLQAASALQIPVVIARSRYFADDPVPGALAVGPELGCGEGWVPQPAAAGRVGLAQLKLWQASIAGGAGSAQR
jgi:HAD superfamily hydrolase (TIGR01509 family)